MKSPYTDVAEKVGLLKEEIHKVIVGYEDIVQKILVCIFSNAHALLVGVPGLAKTLLVKTISKTLDLKFSRIQFTPDLMPSDITGTEIIQETDGRRFFEFVKGPIFSNIILADEINRAPPKTQSALLEAMQERRVSVMGKTYVLEEPFFVLATQNPIEQEGTYPLPEAQLDRFMMRLDLYYPSYDDEKEILRRTTGSDLPEVGTVMSRQEVLNVQKAVREVVVGEHVYDYVVRLVRRTRPQESDLDSVKKYVRWGSGPRGGQFLVLGAKAKALLEGRNYVSTEDVRFIFVDVMKHRLILSFVAEAEDVSQEDILMEILESTPVKD